MTSSIHGTGRAGIPRELAFPHNCPTWFPFPICVVLFPRPNCLPSWILFKTPQQLHELIDSEGVWREVEDFSK